MQSAFATSLEMKQFWLIKWCPIGVNLVSIDRGHIGINYDRRDRKVNGQFLSYSSVFSMVQFCQNIIFIYFQGVPELLVRAVKVHSAFLGLALFDNSFKVLLKTFKFICTPNFLKNKNKIICYI